jgi:hypothetical protein
MTSMIVASVNGRFSRSSNSGYRSIPICVRISPCIFSCRFLEKGNSLNKSDLFLPFGAGKRKCPGEQLAKMELFIFFATMLQRCRFETIPGKTPKIDSKYGLTLKPVDFEVIVSPR